MWESRVLCEISKSLWKPFSGFHSDVISTSIFVVCRDRGRIRGMLYPSRLADRRSWRLLCGRFSSTEPSEAHTRVYEVLLRALLGAQVGVDLGAPAARSALEDMRVMEQPIEQRGDRRGVTEQLAPVIDRPV